MAEEANGSIKELNRQAFEHLQERYRSRKRIPLIPKFENDDAWESCAENITLGELQDDVLKKYNDWVTQEYSDMEWKCSEFISSKMDSKFRSFITAFTEKSLNKIRDEFSKLTSTLGLPIETDNCLSVVENCITNKQKALAAPSKKRKATDELSDHPTKKSRREKKTFLECLDIVL